MNGANLIKQANVAAVAMPLVRLLKHGLSWSDRETVARALQDVLNQFESMEAERLHLNGGSGMQQAQSLVGIVKVTQWSAIDPSVGLSVSIPANFQTDKAAR